MARSVSRQYRPQHQRDRAGFAGARRTQHGEVLAEEIIDGDQSRQARVLMDGADLDT